VRIDPGEIIKTVHARRRPMIPPVQASRSLSLADAIPASKSRAGTNPQLMRQPRRTAARSAGHEVRRSSA
jgi:hypothetical protein